MDSSITDSRSYSIFCKTTSYQFNRTGKLWNCVFTLATAVLKIFSHPIRTYVFVQPPSQLWLSPAVVVCLMLSLYLLFTIWYCFLLKGCLAWDLCRPVRTSAFWSAYFFLLDLDLPRNVNSGLECVFNYVIMVTVHIHKRINFVVKIIEI